MAGEKVHFKNGKIVFNSPGKIGIDQPGNCCCDNLPPQAYCYGGAPIGSILDVEMHVSWSGILVTDLYDPPVGNGDPCDPFGPNPNNCIPTCEYYNTTTFIFTDLRSSFTQLNHLNHVEHGCFWQYSANDGAIGCMPHWPDICGNQFPNTLPTVRLHYDTVDDTFRVSMSSQFSIRHSYGFGPNNGFPYGGPYGGVGQMQIGQTVQCTSEDGLQHGIGYCDFLPGVANCTLVYNP